MATCATYWRAPEQASHLSGEVQSLAGQPKQRGFDVKMELHRSQPGLYPCQAGLDLRLHVTRICPCWVHITTLAFRAEIAVGKMCWDLIQTQASGFVTSIWSLLLVWTWTNWKYSGEPRWLWAEAMRIFGLCLQGGLGLGRYLIQRFTSNDMDARSLLQSGLQNPSLCCVLWRRHSS